MRPAFHVGGLVRKERRDQRDESSLLCFSSSSVTLLTLKDSDVFNINRIELSFNMMFLTKRHKVNGKLNQNDVSQFVLWNELETN